MYNPGNLENNGANQHGVQKRNSENFVGHNMSLTPNNANSPQPDSASKTSTTAALRRWRRPEAQDSSSKNVSARGSSSESENSVKIPSSTVNQSKEMNPLNNTNNNSYANNTHTVNLNGSASQNEYSMFVSPASLSPIVPQSTARPYDTNAYIPRVPPETGAYSRTSPVVTTPNKLTPEVKSSDTTVRHPVSGNIQSPYYHLDNATQQHYRSSTGYPIQNTPPLATTSTQNPIYGVSNQKRDYGYQNYTAKSPQEQRTTREHSVLTHSYSAGSGLNLDSSRTQGVGDDSKMNGYRQDSRVIPQGYQMQNSVERRVTPPKPKSPTYRNFPNSSSMMDSRILAQNYVTGGRVQAAEYMAQNYYLNKSSCIVQEARVQSQIHSTENHILDRYQQSYNSYIMPKSTVINSQDPKLYRNIITSSKKHSAPFPILEQRLNTAESYSPEYLVQSSPQSKYGQVILPRSSPTSRITRDSSTIPIHSNYVPQSSNQKCPQDMMNYTLHNKYFQQNPSQDWRLMKDFEPNAHLNQMNQMHTRLPHSSTNRTPEVPRENPYVDQNQRIIQKPRMFYPEPGSVEYLQFASKTNVPVAQKSPKVISYNVSDQRIPDQIQNDYLNLTRTSSNAVRPNEFSRNPVIQTSNMPEGPYILHQPYRSDVPNDQHNYQMVQNSRHPSYAINYSNRQVKEIPPRNISPRRTFQENMPYFVISPPHAGLSNTSPPALYNSEHSQHNYPGYYSRDPNYPGTGAKSNISQYPIDPTKYQNVPFSRNISQTRHPYGYQEQYFQRNMDPNQFPGNMYRQLNSAMADQSAQVRSYAGEYRNEDSISSSYNEFERNRRKEEIGKSLKEFLESWEDDEDIVSNLPDLVLNIPTDRQKNNSISSLESGENNVAGKPIPTNEMHKDNQGNPQAEPLYVLDARSISSDALSQYLPYCKVYQSLPENIRGFYPNSVANENASVSQKVASETSESQLDNDDLEANIIDSPSPHDLSVNRKKAKEDNVQVEVLNLSTNRNKENDEFMTEEYSNASDDTSVPENESSPSIDDKIFGKEYDNKQCEIIKSPETVQDKTNVDIGGNNKSTKRSEEDLLTIVNDPKDTQKTSSIEIEDKRELKTLVEKPVTASVIVQNTFLPNKSDNSSKKPKENQSEISNIDKSIDTIENISSPKSQDLEKKRSSIDSMESADSIRTSLIESEIKDIDFNKDNLDNDQFDFDTALLSTETKDSNEDSKIDADINKGSLIRDSGIDLSLETMLLSPEPMDTSFEDCIPEIDSSSKNDDISITEETKAFDEHTIENLVKEINLPKNNQIITNLANDNDSFDKPEFIKRAGNEVITENKSMKEQHTDTEEHSDNLKIINLNDELCLGAKSDSNSSEIQTKKYSLSESTDTDNHKESENEIDEQLIPEGNNFDKVDDFKIEISEKEMDLSTMDDENSVFESHFENNKSSFLIEEILKETVNSKKAQEENIEAVHINIEKANIDSEVSKLSETVEKSIVTTAVNEDVSNESNSTKSNEHSLENTEDTTEVANNDDLSEKNNSDSTESSERSLENTEETTEISNNDESSEKNNESVTSSISGDNVDIIDILIENSQKSLEDIELPETETSISDEPIEKNGSSVVEIETSGRTDIQTEKNDSSAAEIESSEENYIQEDLIEHTDKNKEIPIDTNENNSDSTNEINKDDKNKNIEDLSKIGTESFDDLSEMPLEEIINVQNLDTVEIDVKDANSNETLIDLERVEESVINEEKDCIENESSENNLIESNILSPILIQEEVAINEEVTDKDSTDESKNESQINEVEVVVENKPDIDISFKNEDIIACNETDDDVKITNIKNESSLFDEDTMPGFNDLKEDNDKETVINGEVKNEDTEITVKEFKAEIMLDLITTSNVFDLSSEQPTDNLKKENLNESIETTTDYASSDSEEYEHLIKLEDEETLDNIDVKKDDTPINEKIDTISIDETPIDTKKEIEFPIDFNETSIENHTNSVVITSSSVLKDEEEKSPKEIQDELLVNSHCSEDKFTSEEDVVSEEVLEDKDVESTDLLDDDTTTKVNILFNEEVLVEHILTDENITFIKDNSSKITEKVAEKIIVADEPSCVVVYSDDENIVILQSNPNELEDPVITIEESTYIATEQTDAEDANLSQELVVVDMEKEEFILENIIEEEEIGNEVIICDNGIEDDWIQNEEIVESKIEDQDRKADELEKRRLLMVKRREKKKRLAKFRKRKLLSEIKATNKFLEEERKAYTITETLINENSKSNSPFKEKITEDKELFINPENPSSSEDNNSMTHELLNLKPRIKRCFSYIDPSSPKIDFVAPKRRYSNMEHVRNNFKKPIINLDEISNNITKVIENLNKQENLQYLSFEKNKTPDVSKIVDHFENDPKTNCSILNKGNEKHFGRFVIRKVIDIEDLFATSTENLVKPSIKPIISLNSVTEDNREKDVQENQIESNIILDEVIKSNEPNKSESTKLNEPKKEDTNVKLEITNNNEQSVDKFKLERNILHSITQSLNEVKTKNHFDTILDSNYEKLPSFQNYTDDLRKKIKEDVTNKIEENSTCTVIVQKPFPRIDSDTKIINMTSAQNTILPNKQRNIDPRIDRPKETPKPDVSLVLIKNKTPKTFGLTEYTKHYLKMKTGQTIDPPIHFGQNGVKRLDPRLTAKPENIKTVVVSKENSKQKIDINTTSKSSKERKVKINLQDYRNRKLSTSESEKQPTNQKEQLDDLQDMNQEKSDSTNRLINTEPCRFYIRNKSEKTDPLYKKSVEKILIKPKKILEKISNDSFGVSKDNINNTIYSTNNHNLDCNNLSNDNINKTLKSKLDFKIQKPKKRRKRFRNLDASDEEDEVVTKQQNVILENQNGIVQDASLKLNEDSSTMSKHSGSGDSNCSCCVDLNSNGGTTTNNCGLKCHIKLNSLDNNIRNYEINKNTSGISNLKLTLKPVKKKPKPAFAEVLSSIDTVVENEVKPTIKRKPYKPGLNKCDSGKKSTMWTIKNKVPKVIIKRNASGYCAVFRDVSSNPIWQPKIRLKRQKYIENLVLSNQVKISKKIPS